MFQNSFNHKKIECNNDSFSKMKPLTLQSAKNIILQAPKKIS